MQDNFTVENFTKEEYETLLTALNNTAPGNAPLIVDGNIPSSLDLALKGINEVKITIGEGVSKI